MNRPMKSNDLGTLFESDMHNALAARECAYWRLHTIRSFRGVSNPCDFIIMDRDSTALVECKATNKESFSCSNFRQLPHFEKSTRYPHAAIFGICVYFHSVGVYVFASDFKVMDNRVNRRPIRLSNPDSFDLCSGDLSMLLMDLLGCFVY